jgi:hypothetical protein
MSEPKERACAAAMAAANRQALSRASGPLAGNCGSNGRKRLTMPIARITPVKRLPQMRHDDGSAARRLTTITILTNLRRETFERLGAC